MHAGGEIEDGLFLDVIIQGIAAEIPSQGILVHRAKNIVSNDLALFHHPITWIGAAESGHLINAVTHVHVSQAKSPADQSAFAFENAFDVFGGGIGGNVEIFGVQAQQQITYCTTDQVGFKAMFDQLVNDFFAGVTDFAVGQPVFSLPVCDEVMV